MIRRIRLRLALWIGGDQVWSPGGSIVTQIVSSGALVEPAPPEAIVTIQRLLNGRGGLFNATVTDGTIRVAKTLWLDHATLERDYITSETE